MSSNVAFVPLPVVPFPTAPSARLPLHRLHHHPPPLSASSFTPPRPPSNRSVPPAIIHTRHPTTTQTVSAIASSTPKSPSSPSHVTTASPHKHNKIPHAPTGTPTRRVNQLVRDLFHEAKQAERSGHLTTARTLLQKCLTIDPRDSHSWLALARIEARIPYNKHKNSPSDAHHRDEPFLKDQTTPLSPSSSSSSTQSTSAVTNRYAVARKTFETGLKYCPNNLHLLQAWAVHEHKCGDKQRARNLFSHALRIDPSNPYVAHAWGLLELRVGNTQKARDLFSKSCLKRGRVELYVAWGMLEADEGRLDVARRLFNQGVTTFHAETRRYPRLSEANQLRLGNIYREWALMEERFGDGSKARELLSKAIGANPSEHTAYVTLAKLEARKGNLDRAIELSRASIEVSKKSKPSCYVAYGYIEMTYRKNLDKARDIFEAAVHLHPRDPSLLQIYGTLAEKQGDIEKARELFRRSIDAEPKTITLVAWAVLESRQANYTKAKELFNQALATDPRHGPAYNAYGMMLAKIGHLPQARAVFQRGVEAAACASLFHGFALFELRVSKDAQRARDLFRTGSSHSRQNTSFVWHSWGTMEMNLRRPAEARSVFREGLKRYPRNSQLLTGLAMAEAMSPPPGDVQEGQEQGESKHQTSNVERVRELFRRAVVADPTHAHAWQTWGMYELRGGRRDVAVGLFRRGIRVCPRHAALWQAWGVLETGRGNETKARELFRKGVEASSGSRDVVHLYQAWACLEVRCQNVDRARQLLDRALEAEGGGDTGAVWNAYALLEARHGTIAKAREILATALRKCPGHAPLFRVGGETEMRVGKYEEARRLFQQGLEVDPYHAPLYHALAKLEGLIGNVEALADLHAQAARYFGSQAQAVKVMQCGEHEEMVAAVVPTPDGEDAEDDRDYQGKRTPMELALDGGLIPNE